MGIDHGILLNSENSDFAYNKDEHLAILRSLKKNSLNSILSKRGASGSSSFRETYAKNKVNSGIAQTSEMSYRFGLGKPTQINACIDKNS